MINQKEYEILKGLDVEWKWIARDEDSKKSTFPNELWLYEYKPKRIRFDWLGGGGATKWFGYDSLFQFVGDKDSEPYNIAELIEEYETEELRRSYFGPRFPKINGFYNANLATWVGLNESEEAEVNKDIEWLKEEIGELPCVDTVFNSGGSSYIDSAVPVMAVYDLIDQLDEPEKPDELQELIEKYSKDSMSTYDVKVEREKFVNDLQNLLVPKQGEVLSQEWIDNNSINASHDGVTEEYVHVDELENLIIPKQELPVIPKYVADYLESAKKHVSLIQAMELVSINGGYPTTNKEHGWISSNDETFARAWLDGYKVAEEPLYYALFKSHELTLDNYKNLALYRGARSPMYISYKCPLNDEFVIKMSKSQWNELGINDSNVNFVEVEE